MVPRNQQPGRMNEMNAAQLRKLQLNDEDQALMNRFKAQGEGEKENGLLTGCWLMSVFEPRPSDGPLH